MEASYAADFGRDREPMQSRSRRPEYRRKGSAPTRVSGMHCRRNKRWTWGSGRGARVLNMRAFAGCLALALAAVASTASAVTVGDFSLITISGSNAPNTNGRGQVTTPYAISQYETTNAQYVAFLNAVDTTGSNTLGLYSTFMTSNTSGGILFNSAAGPGSKYSVKSGYNQRPVTWTNWSSAARFVNWLVNGGTTNPSASTETGTYLMSGSAPYTRAVNAQIFLPSQDEWYKAAFYNSVSGSYNLWANGSAVTTPVATVSGSAGLASNQANFNNVNAPIGVTNTGIYTSSASPYQVYDMMGNVAEMTDTFSGSSYFLYGGSWQSLAADTGSLAATQLRTISQRNAQLGFRIATVAPVPEPGTIALAATGMVGLVGAGWMKRRRKQAAPLAASAESTIV
jgi:formylglycine-generating enzyme required for sulfatase activity